MIPPFIQQIIGVLVRAAVVAAAGYLAGKAHVTLTEDQIGALAAYLTPIVVVLAWSLRTKFVGRLKFLTAAASSVPMTEHEVEQTLADPARPNPSVLTAKDTVPR